MKIPVIIINRDLVTWPSKMVEAIKTFDSVGDIIIVDNQSTYEPLLKWYKTNPCDIVYSKFNGQSSPWDMNIPEKMGYSYYVVSDPDLDLSETPKDCLVHLKNKLESHTEYDRIGLSLSNYDVSDRSPYHSHLKTWYNNYWKPESINDGLLTQQLFDTTFGIYHIDRHFSGKSCCADKPYSAKHIPWEITHEELYDLKNINPEFFYYLQHATPSTSYKAFVNFKAIFNE
jgi:hypothetical protein